MEVVPVAERVVNAPVEGVVEPTGVFWMDVAVRAPGGLADEVVQVGAPELSFDGVIPPSLTMIAPPESWVVAPSTALASNVASLTALFRVVAVGLSPVENVFPVINLPILGGLSYA
jgi:hypothetical protein